MVYHLITAILDVLDVVYRPLRELNIPSVRRERRNIGPLNVAPKLSTAEEQNKMQRYGIKRSHQYPSSIINIYQRTYLSISSLQTSSRLPSHLPSSSYS